MLKFYEDFLVTIVIVLFTKMQIKTYVTEKNKGNKEKRMPVSRTKLTGLK
jgi:hypothetical protein